MARSKLERINRIKAEEADIAVAAEHLQKTVANIEANPEKYPVVLSADDHAATRMHRALGGKFPRMPITQKRISIFLAILAETGSEAAAARAATPWASSRRGGLCAFHGYMKRHPEFKKLVQQAKDLALGRVEAEIHRRAFTPTRRPIVSHGEIIGHEEKYDNRLLLRQAEKLDKAWSQKQEVEHSGKVEGGVLVVPGIATTEDSWEKQYAGQEHPALDVAEAEIIDES